MRAIDERRAALAAAGTGIQVGAAMVATRFVVDQAGAIAALMGREALTTNKIAGVGLTVIGVVLAFGDKLMAGGADREWVGALAVLASALPGALCSVLYRHYLRRYPMLPLIAFAMLAVIAGLRLAHREDR